MKKPLDLIGQRFSRLIVVQRAADHFEPSGKKVIRWECLCDCGKSTIVSGSQLRKGKTKSCGCLDHPDITGQKFGKLIVLRVGTPKIKPCGKTVKKWLCKCDCGNLAEVATSDLTSGHTTSCGCVKRNALAAATIKHGMTGTRIYNIYRGICARCYNKKSTAYVNWGGRGIIICSEWLGENGFNNFYKWSISHGYADDLTIDRIDNDGNYEPENCRWTSLLVQANNTRKNVYITYNGKTQSLPDWCRELDLEYSMIYVRYRRKWNVERMFNQPKREW